MKKKWIFPSLLLSLIVLMILGNPSQNEYVDWVNNKAQSNPNHATANMMDELLLPKTILEKTERKNLWICSIYQTTNKQAGSMTTLGILNNYLVLYSNY
jgi:Na+/H+ antiporter NhaC